MLALRRSASSLRVQSYNNAGIARICFSQFSLPDYESGNDASTQLAEHACITGGNNIFSKASSRGFSSSSRPFSGYRTLSSQATGKSSDGGSDLEDGFSELEDPHQIDAASDESEEDTKAVLSETGDESESEDQVDELNLLGIEKDVVEKTLPENSPSMILYNVVMKAPRKEVGKALSKYAEDGHPMERNIVSASMLGLRRRNMFDKALQVSEWVESNKCYDLIDRDYASRIDLIAKVHGLYTAEKHIEKIPESFRTEVVYRTLLANSVSSGNIKKSEAVFNKMRELGLPLTDFACNQLLVLYKRVDRKKIADVLMMMEKENVKPSRFTYRLLIDTKGRTNDIDGMEQVVETMKAEGMDADKEVLATVARHYISSGFTEKAEATLKEMEGGDINENRWAVRLLLPLYASLGREDDVERIWKLCKEKTRTEESLAAVEAWGKLGRVERAEEVFEHVYKNWRKISPKYYNALLTVYADHKLLAKGKDLIKRMSNEGCNIGPLTWDALVRLYLGAGEVEKADSVFHKAMERSPRKPMYGTYMALLEKYGKRGDIHNAEKIFSELRKEGYAGRIGMYKSLLDAYINAKTPAYGFRERMKVDNMFPNNTLAGQLRTIESFKKTQVADLLE